MSCRKSSRFTLQKIFERVAFGKQLAELGGNYDVIADCRMEIEMCRLLTYRAADRMDKLGNKIAKSDIAQIKVAVPKNGFICN